MFKFPKYIKREGFDCCSLQVIQPLFQFLSDLSFRISLIFLLTAYDIDPWICFCGPSSITYVEYTHEVHLEFPNGVLMYQRASPFISSTFGLAGWILGCFVQEIDPDQEDGNPDPVQGSNQENRHQAQGGRDTDQGGKNPDQGGKDRDQGGKDRDQGGEAPDQGVKDPDRKNKDPNPSPVQDLNQEVETKI